MKKLHYRDYEVLKLALWGLWDFNAWVVRLWSFKAWVMGLWGFKAWVGLLGLKVHIFEFKGVVIGFEEFRSSFIVYGVLLRDKYCEKTWCDGV